MPSFVATSDSPTLLSYRCVPKVWLDGADTPKTSIVLFLCTHFPEPSEVNSPRHKLCNHRFTKAAQCLSHLTCLSALHMHHIPGHRWRSFEGLGWRCMTQIPQGSTSLWQGFHPHAHQIYKQPNSRFLFGEPVFWGHVWWQLLYQSGSQQETDGTLRKIIGGILINGLFTKEGQS